MVSRLDRLFILLDTGSNESVRLAAAKQLGEVQRIQPNELNYLLKRIKEYSRKSVWETRVAAGHATRCVLEHLDPWPKQSDRQIIKPEHMTTVDNKPILDIIQQNANTEQFLRNFNLAQIVSDCPTLLSTNVIDGDDLDPVAGGPSSNKKIKCRKTSSSSSTSGKKTTKEQLKRQRLLINKELGISMADSLNLGVRSTDIVSNDDLLPADYSADSNECQSPSGRTMNNKQQDIRHLLNGCVTNYERLIETLARLGIVSESEKQAQDNEDNYINTNQWPLNQICHDYVDDLFNPSWEIRHGAAIALREIVKLHGRSAGRREELADNEAANDQLNQLWLVDMALVALCVLSLDRFGDFLFDQVIAPVRENTAQLLGCCVSFMTNENSTLVINILLKMLNNQHWETRHGGILGLKYSLNVLDNETIKHNLTLCFDAIFKCLSDSNDDVSAEAAASLLPVNDMITETIPEKTPKLIKFLWDHIAELDELTTSTSNIILLLASLITTSSAQLDPSELITSIPKLWPLLSHNSTNVRISVLKAFITLIKPQQTSCLHWMPDELMSTALRLIFQRSILENAEEVRPLIHDVWTELIKIDAHGESSEQVERFNLLKSTSQYLNYWLCLTMQPSSVPIDRGNPFWLNIKSNGIISDIKPDGEVYIASITFNAETMEQQKTQITICRLLGTKLLGTLYANLVIKTKDFQHAEETAKYLADMFIHYLKTKSAQQRTISGWAIESWAFYQAKLNNVCDPNGVDNLDLPDDIVKQLNLSIQEINLCYDELAANMTRLQQEAREFVSSLVALGIITNLPHANDRRIIYNLSQLQTMCDINLENEFTTLISKKTDSTKLNDTYDVKSGENYSQLFNKQSILTRSHRLAKASQRNYSISVLSSLACALISWCSIPDRLKLVIEPLLDSIEAETELTLQTKSVKYLIKLMNLLCDKKDNLVESIIDRLVDALNSYTIQQSDINNLDQNKIIQLDNLQRKAEISIRGLSRRQSSINSTTSSLKRSLSLNSTSSEIETNSLQEFDGIATAEIKHRGVTLALNEITKHFAKELPEKLPLFWSYLNSDLKMQIANYESNIDNKPSEKLIRSLILLKQVGEQLDQSVRDHMLDIYPSLIKLLKSNDPILRHQSAQCIGLISKLMFNEVETMIAQQILPMLDLDNEVLSRCGSIEVIAILIENLQLDLVPKINMFIVQVLRRMSDQNDQIRLMATHCFGKLLSLMPLNFEKSKLISNDENNKLSLKSAENINNQAEEAKFIEQLLDSKRLSNYEIPFETNVQLRTYQQEGLNWLAFLNRFNLHGILCDEMGLGKTFMTICMVASDHFSKEKTNSKGRLPSLIVCPSTLIEHWLCEIEKFVPTRTRSILNPVGYAGSIGDRMYLRNCIANIFDQKSTSHEGQILTDKQPINILVTSYDVLRNDIDFFKTVNWNYCVLDEGHIIKNGKTKLSRAVRLLTAAHRLILSGTPIQNNVTELWSLFDFLMPGFLGSERQFNSRYTKPILQSREPKCSSRELEAGALAMESLHRQVLPFILRRLKEDVLDDLPPKIIQDYYCELSSLQSKLYEDFTRSRLCIDVTRKSLDQLNEQGVQLDASSKSHVFQALQYLRNVCNHPKLVLTPKHPQYVKIREMLNTEHSSLDDINHSSKLKALKQLLIDCGLGIANQVSDETSSQQQQQQIELESVVNQHRALVFCQLRSMVDIIENDLFKKHLTNITYLKLDGSVPANQRQSIVSRFNNDPSIDILLLTTQIGGLGLNLTGADTVIFVEHDWNPTRDLQAMDRAHRIGQKKVVNVYRLITKCTLEEKIMGLQKFKTMVSSTVINQDNTGLNTMNVDQLLDLFEDNSPAKDKRQQQQQSDRKRQQNNNKSSNSNFVDLLPELWDQQQYDTEYDLSKFVSSLKS